MDGTLSEEQIRLDRLDLVGRLADDLSHEIKNPLHAMVINLELVKRRLEDDPADARTRVGTVEREVHRVHDLMDSLLRLVRPPGGANDVSDVDAVLVELEPMLHALARVAGAEADVATGELFARVGLDARALKQALLNAYLALLDTPRRERAMPRHVEVRATRAEDGVHVRLSADSGFGAVTNADAPWAAGLVVSRALAERAGGALAVEPGADDAGTLHFSLPITRS